MKKKKLTGELLISLSAKPGEPFSSGRTRIFVKSGRKCQQIGRIQKLSLHADASKKLVNVNVTFLNPDIGGLSKASKNAIESNAALLSAFGNVKVNFMDLEP